MDTAAATLITMVFLASDGEISRARSAMPTGLTPSMTTEAPFVASLLLSGSSAPAMVMTWWRSASSAARSARRTVATTSEGSVPAASRPPRMASFMDPQPRNAIRLLMAP